MSTKNNPTSEVEEELKEASPPVASTAGLSVRDNPGTIMLANRLRKNMRVVGKWARKQSLECFRVYDADLPEYAFAIDFYGDFIHMQEYLAPSSIDEAKVIARREQALVAVQLALDVPANRIQMKIRQRQRGKEQYQSRPREYNERTSGFVVREGAAKFWVNLEDYLDTGLFLDHRPMRKFIYENAADKRFLNLFSYTASASVHAALGGAKSSLSIDMSNTYLDWARKNFGLNGIGGTQHQLKRADCIAYLESVWESKRNKFDLIFLDPPTFSNSKHTENVLDIQRDHVSLITNTMNKLERDGLLIFSTNKRSFKLDASLADKFKIKDFTQASLDRDFQRSKKIHQTWLLNHK